MWLKPDEYEVMDDVFVRTRCPHCGATVRFRLVSEGANAAGPKMGH